MSGENYNIISRLPVLPDFGAEPPLGFKECLDSFENENPKVAQLAKIYAINVDLPSSAPLMDGSMRPGVVLVPGDFKDFTRIKRFFSKSTVEKVEFPEDLDLEKSFELYFRLAELEGEESDSKLFSDWVIFEVSFRNFIAKARAKKLHIPEMPKKILRELVQPFAFEKFESDFLNVSDPIKEIELSESLRYQWLLDNDAWFSFSDDELLAYCMKLLCLERYQCLTQIEINTEE